MAFARTLPQQDLWLGEMQSCDVGGRRVLLLRLESGVYAYEDRCAHLRVPLSNGTLRDGVLTCAAHRFQYDALTGCGINPKHARLVPLPVRVEEGQIWVDPDGALESSAQGERVACPRPAHASHVGPVLEGSEQGRAVLAAIHSLNVAVEVVDRGAYVRVLVPGRCVVTRRAIEQVLGKPFRLTAELEPLMPAFKGFLQLDDERAEWRSERA